MRLALRVASVVALICASLVCDAQISLAPQLGPQANRSKAAVSYDDEPQQIVADKPQLIELRFVIANGYHINSAKPKGDLLIPTRLNTLPETGVKQQPPEYPAGVTFSFPGSPDEKLDVYSGVILVKIPIVAKAGAHQIGATLHYQACDNASCYPPKDLQVPIAFFAK